MRFKLFALLFVCITLNSCTDNFESLVDVNDDETFGVFTDGYSLTMKVTLDNMGGTGNMRAPGDEDENPLAELENYIDPEKFRVLFFDREDRFLFESKSRWIKKIVPNEDNDHSEWFVSVPLYDYGNDEAYNWNWEEIRRVLTGEDINDKDDEGKDIYQNKTGDVAFKIAILANRPGIEWSMGMYGRDSEGKDMTSVELTPNKWKLLNGPFWNNEHTRWGENPKEVFDLHHCQYDPIYDGKSYNDRGGIYQKDNPAKNGEIWRPFGPTGNNGERYWYQDLDVYDFISGRVKLGEGFDEFENRPTMGATSTWVSWKGDDKTDRDNIINKKTNVAEGLRKFVRLTKDHPIPMYGIQAFSEIKDWVKGTPFNLSYIADGQESSDYNFKSISLLRSVVKLELVLPGGIEKPQVAMIYPNIYARCEPVDVWTPTDEIWNSDPHDDNTENCEWYTIRKYGPISTTKKYTSDAASVQAYKEKMKWFYGAWTDKKWPFLSSGNPTKVNNLEYPRIFNSCVQRNGQVSCVDVDYSDLFSDGNYHFIVYTGEKNINDPSNIAIMGDQGNGSAPITAWWVKVDTNKEYGFALAPYDPDKGVTTIGVKVNGKDVKSSETSAYYYNTDGTPTSRFRIYESRVQGYTESEGAAIEPFNPQTDYALMPWPLVRNHVYRIKIGTMRSGGGMSIQSEVLHSKSINFDKQRKEKETEKKVTEKK